MRLSRRTNKMISEPPAVLLTDLAFNLVIFFVVCASTTPETGRKQAIPRSSKDQSAQAQEAKNLVIDLDRTTLKINGNVTPLGKLMSQLQPLLANKNRPEDRMVVVKSAPDTPYQRWIQVTGMIEQAGGLIAVQVEEGKEIKVK